MRQNNIHGSTCILIHILKGDKCLIFEDQSKSSIFRSKKGKILSHRVLKNLVFLLLAWGCEVAIFWWISGDLRWWVWGSVTLPSCVRHCDFTALSLAMFFFPFAFITLLLAVSPYSGSILCRVKVKICLIMSPYSCSVELKLKSVGCGLVLLRRWLPMLALFGRIWGVLGTLAGRRLVCRRWLCSFGGGTKVVVLLRGHIGVVSRADVVLGWRMLDQVGLPLCGYFSFCNLSLMFAFFLLVAFLF